MIKLQNINNIFFTADNHFYHRNILSFCNRPFNTVEAMNQTMIDNWNHILNDDSVIYHLGDLTLEDHNHAYDIISQLKGLIVFVTPQFHHDKRWWGEDYISKSGHEVVFTHSLELMQIERKDDWPLKITLCHYPLDEWEASFHGSLHFHGHSHGNLPKKKNRVDVGVDSWGYAPVSLRQLLEVCDAKI